MEGLSKTSRLVTLVLTENNCHTLSYFILINKEITSGFLLLMVPIFSYSILSSSPSQQQYIHKDLHSAWSLVPNIVINFSTKKSHYSRKFRMVLWNVKEMWTEYSGGRALLFIIRLCNKKKKSLLRRQQSRSANSSEGDEWCFESN